MSGSRADILARIRSAHRGHAGDRVTEYTSLARSYRVEGGLDVASRLALFVERLEHYQVRVLRCPEEQVAAAIADALGTHGRGRILVPPDLNHAWLPEGIDFTPDVGLTYGDLDGSGGVITACTLGIAVTGSIVLCHGPGEGRRALTLVPDYHVCVVTARQVVETVPEAIRRLVELRPGLITTIAGPSATADIEMTRIRGVHGPRTLEVILAG